MEPQITSKQRWIYVDGTDGVLYIPVDSFVGYKAVARENYSGEIWEINGTSGYGARLYMPGYMDCTDWAVYPTAKEAARSLLNMFYCDDPEYMSSEEKDSAAWLESICGTD